MTATFQICRNQSIGNVYRGLEHRNAERGGGLLEYWRRQTLGGNGGSRRLGLRSMKERQRGSHLMNYVAPRSGRQVHVDLKRERGVQLKNHKNLRGFHALFQHVQGGNIFLLHVGDLAAWSMSMRHPKVWWTRRDTPYTPRSSNTRSLRAFHPLAMEHLRLSIYSNPGSIYTYISNTGRGKYREL